jgi:hypothetical protein
MQERLRDHARQLDEEAKRLQVKATEARRLATLPITHPPYAAWRKLSEEIDTEMWDQSLRGENEGIEEPR